MSARSYTYYSSRLDETNDLISTHHVLFCIHPIRLENELLDAERRLAQTRVRTQSMNSDDSLAQVRHASLFSLDDASCGPLSTAFFSYNAHTIFVLLAQLEAVRRENKALRGELEQLRAATYVVQQQAAGASQTPFVPVHTFLILLLQRGAK